jgi:hypothetical protein
MSYYDAYTDSDLREELLSCGYFLRWTENEDQLELWEFGGGGISIHPYWERSTGELFNSVESAHRYAIMEGK